MKGSPSTRGLPRRLCCRISWPRGGPSIPVRRRQAAL
jgi:hypothetical protein